MELTQVKSALCVAAHPDDESGGAGGTLLLMRKLGVRLTLVLCTSGEVPGVSRPKGEAGLRVQEFENVAKRLNSQAVFLDFPRYFTLQLDTLLPLVKAIRASKPEMVFAPSTGEEHPEHIAAGKLTYEACRIARRKKFPELGDPWKVLEFRSYELDNAFVTFDTLENISDVAEQKAELLRVYGTQSTNKDYASAALGLNQYRGITKRFGSYAEAFQTTRVI